MYRRGKKLKWHLTNEPPDLCLGLHHLIDLCALAVPGDTKVRSDKPVKSSKPRDHDPASDHPVERLPTPIPTGTVTPPNGSWNGFVATSQPKPLGRPR